MQFNLDKIFTTITLSPMKKGNYIEIEPSNELKPYIRCFWSSEYRTVNTSKILVENSLIIPDICMDIILSQNNHNICSSFCGIYDKAFSSGGNYAQLFGIRFYAWSVVLFADEHMNGIRNTFANVNEYFFDFSNSLKDEIMSADSIFKRKEIAEKYLFSKLNNSRMNYNVMNSLYYIISNNGKATVDDLSHYCVLSKRQLERKFLENSGVSPKQMINLIRYQLLWQDCVKRNFDAGTAVEKFGYYDQSHMLKEFKRYHGMSLSKAKNLVAEMSLFYNTNQS